MLRWWLAVLVLGLAACGGDGGGGDGPEPNKPNEPNEETPEPKIVSVELSAAEFDLEVGQTRQLEAVVTGEGELDASVIWSSSNESVATVTDGLVTAVAEGKATITARSRADESKFASAEVTVVAQPPPPPTHGSLVIVLDGLPEEVAAGLGETHRYLPAPETQTVEVEGDETAEAAISYRSLLRFPFDLKSDGAVLPQVGTTVLVVEVTRHEAIEGEVELSLVGLPEGVTAKTVVLAPEETVAVFDLASDGSVREFGVHQAELRAEAGELFASAPVEIDIVARVITLVDEEPGSLRHYVEGAPPTTSRRAAPFSIPAPWRSCGRCCKATTPTRRAAPSSTRRAGACPSWTRTSWTTMRTGAVQSTASRGRCRSAAVPSPATSPTRTAVPSTSWPAAHRSKGFASKGTRSIVADNYADSLGHDVFTDDFGGTFFDDYNLFNNLDASDITTRATDIVGISPELLPLDDYGGPTAMMLPDASSPAVDHIPAGDCNDFDGNPLLVDQRGSPRPSGGGCDIGAVERQQ